MHALRPSAPWAGIKGKGGGNGLKKDHITTSLPFPRTWQAGQTSVPGTDHPTGTTHRKVAGILWGCQCTCFPNTSRQQREACKAFLCQASLVAPSPRQGNKRSAQTSKALKAGQGRVGSGALRGSHGLFLFKKRKKDVHVLRPPPSAYSPPPQNWEIARPTQPSLRYGREGGWALTRGSDRWGPSCFPRDRAGAVGWPGPGQAEQPPPRSCLTYATCLSLSFFCIFFFL